MTTGSGCTNCQPSGPTGTIQHIETGPALRRLVNMRDVSCTRRTDSAMKTARNTITTLAKQPPVADQFLSCNSICQLL